MISHNFDYHAPTVLAEALALLGQAASDAAVMAGGTWLVPNMTYGVQQPALVLDARRLGLNGISEIGDDVVVGGLTTYRQLLASDLVSTQLPLLFEMAGQITGGAQIVGQGTAGGSACYANPSSDIPACLVALNARLLLASSKGEREVDAATFFTGAFQTVRLATEMLTAIRIPRMPPQSSSGYYKLKFSTGSWPIVTAACISTVAAGELRHHRIAIGGANTTPVILEAAIAPDAPRDELAKLAARASDLIADEWCDEFAGPGYRRKVAPSVVLNALVQSTGVR